MQSITLPSAKNLFPFSVTTLCLAVAVSLAGCTKKAPPPPPPKIEKPAPKPEPKPAELPPGKPGAEASSGEGDYKPDFASDGNPSTRWGSGFTDNEWIIFDLGKTTEVAGARIDWETAYGKDYDISVSMDKKEWTKVCQIRDGDGGADELFFKPVKARFVKLQGLRRGTGWGYSIFEFQTLKADDLPLVSATPAEKGEDPQKALDGDPSTAWSSTSKDAKTITIDLRKPRQVGGLELSWKENPGSYVVSVSSDEKTWNEVVRIGDTDGGRDLVFFKPASCRWIKIETPGGGPAGLAEVGLKGADADFSLVRQFEALASRLPDGSTPRWLKRNQTFWTITGVPSDTEETLLGEEATVEPYKDSFCVMPFIQLDGKVLTPKDYKFNHTLEDSCLPIPTVHMQRDGKDFFNVTTVSFGPAGESVTAARYQIQNNGDQPLKVRLNLIVWPLQLNPPWQYGGVSPIKQATLLDDQNLQINGKLALRSLTPPTAAGVSALKDGDAFSSIRSGKVPDAREAKDSDGAVSAVLAYDLDIEPHGSKSVVVLFPLHETSNVNEPDANPDPDKFFSGKMAGEKKVWEEKLLGWKMKGAPAWLENVVRSNLAYMLLNRDLFAAQPGPRNYSHAWMRDGSVSTATYLRFGFTDEARSYLEWFTPLVRDDGFVPFLIDAKTGKMLSFANDWKEFDSQGEYVYAVHKYYEFTGDRAFLEKTYPTVQKAIAYMEARLDERRTDKYKDTKFYGILPESNSHEGYFPGVHSYWDDFWALRGLGDAAIIANALDKKEDAKKYQDAQQQLRTDLYASFKKTMGNNPHMPGCAEKDDFDVTSTSIGLTACSELSHLQEDPDLSKALKYSYDQYVNSLKPRYTPGAAWGSYTPYEARNIEALVRLGRREDAFRLLEFLTGSSMRPTGWNLLAEVVHYEPSTGSYIGDMPHTWVGADLVNASRSFFLLDDGGVVQIAPGVLPAWITAESPVIVENLPTGTGKLSYTLKRVGESDVSLHVDGTAAPPGGFIFRPPFPVKSIKVSGVDQPYDEKEGIKFDSIPVEITMSLGK